MGKVLRFKRYSGRRYWFAGNYRTKAGALKESAEYRKNGYRSRVSKDDGRGGYSVMINHEGIN